jgi:hypothetical protein
MTSSRRSFLKIGAVATLLLAAGGGIYRFTRPPALPLRFALDGDARAVIDALVPAFLASSTPADAQARAEVTARVHQAILGLPLSAQKEVQDLFGLLALAPARRWLAGVPDGWNAATPQQLHAFLQDWRTHRLALFRTAYGALHDLIYGAWYGHPSSWAAIGYPGPIKELAS